MKDQTKATSQMALDLRALAERFYEGFHEGIEIDTGDIVLLLDAVKVIEALVPLPTVNEGNASEVKRLVRRQYSDRF